MFKLKENINVKMKTGTKIKEQFNVNKKVNIQLIM